MKALSRSEWLLLMTALSAAVLWHRDVVSWPRFALAFTAIDLVGYLPGALAFRRARGSAIAPVYHWPLQRDARLRDGGAGGLGLDPRGGRARVGHAGAARHLAGDRGAFGNGFKPSAEPFEPARCPA